MASSLTYSKMAGFATTAGQEFEMQLCALVFLRARNRGLEFQLGSNVKGAGALDDLVFRCKTPQAPDHWQTIYVQLKHREKSTVKRKMLTSPEGDFSLLKYFQSYREIKQTMSERKETLLEGSFEDSQFVIYTNANGNKDWGEWKFENLSFVEQFLWLGSGKIYSFETDEEMLGCLGEEGGKFLSRLRLFCGQPNANELKVAVKQELQKLDAKTMQGLQIDRLCDCYLDFVKVWYESKKFSDILHNDHDILLRAIDKVRLESCSEQTMQTHRLELEFEEACLPLPGIGLSVVQCSAGSCRLSLTKLVQARQGQCLVLTCQQLTPNKRALLGERDVKRLIVCTQDWSLELADSCFEVIKQMLGIMETWDIVFLQNGNSSVGSELTRMFQGSCQSSLDKFNIFQLTNESRDKFFGKAVNLQGYCTTLLELCNKDCASASQILDASLVATIMESAGPLTVGSALPEGIGYFVERTLEWVSVKASVFRDLRGTVTIRVTQTEKSAITFLEMALNFVCSLKDSRSLNPENTEDVVNKLIRSQLNPDKDDGAVCVGPKFLLGFYECNCVGLRLGRDNANSALWVCPSKDPAENVSFLFVSNQTKEDDARKLSEFHKSTHLLLLNEGQLRWIESHEDIGFVRQHFDKDRVLELNPETATDVPDRLVLVCAEPGMGKSTLMARLAKNTKAALPHYFVIAIALNDHTTLFSHDKHKDVLGFLSSASKMDSSLERALLQHALEVSGNAVIIADGFDEIAPKYLEKCGQLVSSLLSKTKASKIWMTSRHSIKLTLEERFSKFSAKLRKFGENDQRDFLKKFWAESSDIKLSVEDLDKFIDKLLGKTSRAIRDQEKNFMGIPLQTQMLAEVYEDHVTDSAEKSELPAKLDLLRLLVMFVDKKCNVYVKNKLKIASDHTDYDDLCESMTEKFIESHSTAALSVIIGDDDLKTLGMERVIRKSSEFCKTISSGKDKTGFIVDVVDGKPRFTHRVFAEYFVAKWISKRLAKCTELISSKLFTVDLGIVRTIVDQILSRDFPLHTAVLNEDPQQVRALLDEDPEQVRASLGEVIEQVRTLLDENPEQVRTFEDLEQVRTLLGQVPEQVRTLQRDCTEFRDSPLNQLLLEGKYLERTQTLMREHLERVRTFLGEDLEQSQTLLGEEMEQWQILLGQVPEQVRTLLDEDPEQVRTLPDQNLDQVRTLLDEDPEQVRTLLGQVLEQVRTLPDQDPEQVRTLPDQDPEQVRTLLGQVPEQVRILLDKIRNQRWIFINKKLDQMRTLLDKKRNHVLTLLERQVNLVKSTDRGGRTALHLAAGLGSSEVREENVRRGEILDLLIGKTSDFRIIDNVLGGSPLRYADITQSWVAIDKLLRKSDHNQQLLLTSANIEHEGMLDTIFDLNLDRLLGFCLDNSLAVDYRSGQRSHRLLHRACKKGSLNLASLLIDRNADINYIIDDRQSPLGVASFEGHLDIVKLLYEKLAKSRLHDNNTSATDISTAFKYTNTKDEDGNTAMHYAAWSGHSSVITFLISQGGDKNGGSKSLGAVSSDEDDDETEECTVECVERIVQAGTKLSQVGRDGRAPLMTAARQGKQEVVEWMLHNFNAQKEDMSLLEFVNMQDEFGKTAMHHAARFGHASVLTFLISQGGDTGSRDMHIMTPLHWAAWSNNSSAVRVLLEVVDEAGRAAVVNSCDNRGRNVLMCAVRYAISVNKDCWKCVELLVQAGAKLSQVGRDGETPLLAAARQGRQEVVKWILQNFNTEKEDMSQLELINKKNEDGNTAMHYAVQECSLESVELLFQAGAKLAQVGSGGVTLMMAAAREDKREVMEWMLHNFNAQKEAMSPMEFVNMQDNYGDTAMHYAAQECSLESVELLFQAGAKLAQVGSDGETPLVAAAREGRHEVVEWMLHKFNAQKENISSLEFVNIMDEDGNTAMHYMARGGFVECVKLLVQAGAKLSQVGRDG